MDLFCTFQTHVQHLSCKRDSAKYIIQGKFAERILIKSNRKLILIVSKGIQFLSSLKKIQFFKWIDPEGNGWKGKCFKKRFRAWWLSTHRLNPMEKSICWKQDTERTLLNSTNTWIHSHLHYMSRHKFNFCLHFI